MAVSEMDRGLRPDVKQGVTRRNVLKAAGAGAGLSILALLANRIGIGSPATTGSRSPDGTTIPANGPAVGQADTPRIQETQETSGLVNPNTAATPVNIGGSTGQELNFNDPLANGAKASGSIAEPVVGSTEPQDTGVVDPVDIDPQPKENSWNKLRVKVEDERFGFTELRFNPDFNHPKWGSAENTWDALVAVLHKRSKYIGEILTANSQATRSQVDESQLTDIDIQAAIDELKSGKAGKYRFPSIAKANEDKPAAIPQLDNEIDPNEGLDLNWRVNDQLTTHPDDAGNVRSDVFTQWRIVQGEDGQLTADALFKSDEFTQPYANQERALIGSSRYLLKTMLLLWFLADPRKAQGHHSPQDDIPNLGKRPQDKLITDLLFQPAAVGIKADGKNAIELNKSIVTPLLVG